MRDILLLEDDKALNRGITLTLQKAGYRVTSAFTLSEAEACFDRNPFALVISDITLPDGTGLDFGRKVRQAGNTYLIYLTALDTEADIVNGYDAGADDYITKPFSLMVLVSKVNALMRRLGGSAESSPGFQNLMISGGIQINCQEMKVFKNGVEQSLSKKELQLLMFLWENAGQILSREKILEHVWDVDGQFVDDNTVTVNISRLKNKLGTDEISNVRGLGYIWTGSVTRK
ncbi:MAG: response regulator transcription factor [Blautia sp.]|nr:response regulator transcription factor [Blautia sp.]